MSSQNFISRRFDGTTAIFFKGDAFWTKLTLQCYIGNTPVRERDVTQKGAWRYAKAFIIPNTFRPSSSKKSHRNCQTSGFLSCLCYVWKSNGPEHVKVIAAPYTDPDQPVRPDQNHHMATQSAPLHREKTVTLLRRLSTVFDEGPSTPNSPIRSIDFKVISLENQHMKSWNGPNIYI